MADFNDYEALPHTSSMSINMAAGAAAGIMEHCVMFPIDCVKTRMQSLSCEKQVQHRGILWNLFSITREEGIFRPLRGVKAMALGAGPAHALYFSTYEYTKSTLLQKCSKPFKLPEFASYAIAGALATVVHDSLMTPVEVIKQRMQMCCSPYSSCWQTARTIYIQEGFRAFYRSYITSLSMNVPFQATHFMTYEFVQSIMNPQKLYLPQVHFVAGALAGAVAAVVTMPLDVCKTLLNTQDPRALKQMKISRVVGIWGASSTILSAAGWSGFFKGVWPRIIYQMPATALSWSAYEFFKNELRVPSTLLSNDVEVVDKSTCSSSGSTFLTGLWRTEDVSKRRNKTSPSSDTSLSQSW